MRGLAWVTGASGLIGSHIARAAPTNWHVHALTRGDLDLTNLAAVRAAFERDQPQLVIHCAALSSTTTCEANPDLAWTTNLDSTKQLTELAAGIPLLFFSTDLVFDGRKGDYNEGDVANPLSLYAETKVAAERAVLANSKHTVIRTTLTAGTSPRGDRSFDEQLQLAWQRGETTRLFVDEFRSPIAAVVTARAVWEIVTRNVSGLFHLGGAERISRYALGQLIAAHWPQLNPRIEPISVHDFAGRRRPPDTSLDSSKVQPLLSFPLPNFSEWWQEQSSQA